MFNGALGEGFEPYLALLMTTLDSKYLGDEIGTSHGLWNGSDSVLVYRQTREKQAQSMTVRALVGNRVWTVIECQNTYEVSGKLKKRYAGKSPANQASLFTLLLNLGYVKNTIVIFSIEIMKGLLN